MWSDVLSSFFNTTANAGRQHILRTYLFILFTTWVVLITFSIAMFWIGAWFSFAVCLFGATIVMPLCLYFAKRKDNNVFGRALFVGSCNLFVLFGSLGCNNLIQAQFFFISISICSVISFSQKERYLTYASLAWIVAFWFLTQVDAEFLIPPNLIQTNVPETLFQSLSFIGALVLSVSYLVFYAREIEGHHLQLQRLQRESNKERMKALELLTKIANNVPGVVYQYQIAADGKASFPYASEGMNQIYRLSPQEVRQNADAVMKLLHPNDLDHVIKTIQDSAQTLKPWQCDYRVKFEDGSVEWRRGIAQPQRDADGTVLWHGFITDVTNEKKLEFELQQSQLATIHSSRLASLGEMAGGIAHEINTPLMIISSKTSLLDQILNGENPSMDRVKSELEKIRQTTFRIGHIVKGLLTFARGDKNHEFQEIEVSSIFQDVSSLCSEKAKSANIEIRFKADETLWVKGLSVQITQVLLNLINNSIDAISQNEELWIEVQAVATENGQAVRFSVTDSGKGLSKEQIEKLMQPFFTTKAIGKGTGLGLSISKGLVENHGGTLTYDRECPNTRFYFDLKRVDHLEINVDKIA